MNYLLVVQVFVRTPGGLGLRGNQQPEGRTPASGPIPAEEAVLITPTLDHLQHRPSRAALRLRITYQRGQR
jgi:hypothetical protein